jgi:hypothetical protein
MKYMLRQLEIIEYKYLLRILLTIGVEEFAFRYIKDEDQIPLFIHMTIHFQEILYMYSIVSKIILKRFHDRDISISDLNRQFLMLNLKYIINKLPKFDVLWNKDITIVKPLSYKRVIIRKQILEQTNQEKRLREEAILQSEKILNEILEEYNASLIAQRSYRLQQQQSSQRQFGQQLSQQQLGQQLSQQQYQQQIHPYQQLILPKSKEINLHQILSHNSDIDNIPLKKRKNENYEMILEEIKYKNILSQLLDDARNMSFILLIDVQNIFKYIYSKLSFRERYIKMQEIFEKLDGTKPDTEDIKLYVKESIDDVFLVRKILKAIDKKKVYYVFITQKNLEAPESWIKVIRESTNSIIIGIACKDFDMDMDCYLTSFKENPMDDYVLLLIKIFFSILYDYYDKHYNMRLEKLIEKKNEIEESMPHYKSEKYYRTLNRLNIVSKKLRTSKNPIPMTIDVSFDLRKDWISKK